MVSLNQHTPLSGCNSVGQFYKLMVYFVKYSRGEVMNGGFGLVLDGSNEAADRARSMLSWDVSNGVSAQTPEPKPFKEQRENSSKYWNDNNWDFICQVARRSWSGNSKAEETICRAMKEDSRLKVTIPHHVQDPSLLDRALKK